MPSRKVASRRMKGGASQCNKTKASASGAMFFPCSLDVAEKAQSGEEETPMTSGQHMMLRSPSQKSISTDEGSSSGSTSCGSSNPGSCEGRFSPCNGGHAECGGLGPSSCLPERISIPNAPLWVDNGLQGDAAAWLLVQPKIPPKSSDGEAFGSTSMPKSPKDAVLLGPYVTTKNTFLDEIEVGAAAALELRLHSRSKSMGARPRSLTGCQ